MGSKEVGCSRAPFTGLDTVALGEGQSSQTKIVVEMEEIGGIGYCHGRHLIKILQPL